MLVAFTSLHPASVAFQEPTHAGLREASLECFCVIFAFLVALL